MTGQQVADLVRNPGIWALLAVLAAGVLFVFGTSVGAALHDAFDGDTGAAITFGVVVVVTAAGLVALGAAVDRWLDSRR